MSNKKTTEAFEYAKQEIPGLKAISAVEIASGLPYGSLVVDKTFDLDAASAYNSEVIKAKIKAKNAMGMKSERIQLMIIELDTQVHMIQPSKDEKFLVYMAADKSMNMGITRHTMLEVSKMIQENIS